MKENEKATFRTQLPVFLAQIVLCGAMLGVYALLGRFSRAVFWGALVGMAASLLNHAGMIFSLLRAEQSDSPQRGQLKAQGNYMLRMLLMFGALILAIKFGKTDAVATVLPIVLMRVALFIGGLMIKKGLKGEKAE